MRINQFRKLKLIATEVTRRTVYYNPAIFSPPMRVAKLRSTMPRGGGGGGLSEGDSAGEGTRTKDPLTEINFTGELRRSRLSRKLQQFGDPSI